ncbi:Sec translocon accessory complex subunit YajC [Koleobacter methoxysyntrophicus]|uniref:Sec translocon accessory complex subunit YajC n=1 Tax=Koleobacter methoxysyntrophicus TaxID=2751313 RepID=A0A8A0RS12_9FIRM|nr:preprotein translocase subunit YajC [Koleobacter methoxysyntrophicus]MDI3540898.1 preprotein translocase subunit YajC [Thermosediminibacterales bacterium]MDK2901329.1 preprotein translocase subunit YajC [Thermosediminibacterales bacterium]QSQ09976.1 Sec translocon accessory complex subunit YajC [Koleobacter methoxysyntrophicus]
MDLNLFLRQFGPLIFIFIIFYFLLIRPQQKRDKERKQMLGSLKEGDQIITIGGIYGKILDIKDDIITLEIGDKVKIKVTRTAIGNVINK